MRLQLGDGVAEPRPVLRRHVDGDGQGLGGPEELGGRLQDGGEVVDGGAELFLDVADAGEGC